MPLFAGLSHKEREKIARWADTIDLPAGKHLLDEGRLPHEFFVILDGEVEVLHGTQHLATLGPGDFFGEIALLEHDRRTATVVASSAMQLMVMATREFDSMCHDYPVVADRITNVFRERREH